MTLDVTPSLALARRLDAARRGYAPLLRAYLAPQWRPVLVVTVLLLASTVLQVVTPQLMRFFIDTATASGATGALTLAGVGYMAAMLADQVLWVTTVYLSEDVGWRATNRVRADLSAHLLSLDMSFHNARTPGELIERVDGDPTALSTFFSQMVVWVIGGALMILGILAALFREDWRAGASLAAYCVVALLGLRAIRSLAVRAFAGERQSSAELYGFLEERLAGVPDIHANGGQTHVLRRFLELSRQRYRRGLFAALAGNAVFRIADALFVVGYLLALGVGAWLFRAGAITLGTVYLIFHYTELLRFPLEQIARQLQDFQKASAGISRIRDLLALRSAVHDGPGAALAAGALEVAFHNVTFHYGARNGTPVDGTASGAGGVILGSEASETAVEQGGPPALDEVSFRVAPGRVLGVLGRTGSGKTTLTRLLFRFYDPTCGEIRLGGAPIAALRLEQLHRAIGIVTQDVQLFDATLRDNLTLFDPAVPDAQIVQVLAELGLGDWLAGLPHGLDTPLAAGGLSAGEAQLLALTRVFLRDPQVVILDEASSRLDPATEQRIERAIDTLLRGRTALVIAHRLGTVQRADDILILEGGRVREHGPRAALAAGPHSRFAALLRAGMEEVLA